MKDVKSKKYITPKDKTKTEQNASAGRMMEMTMTSEHCLIPGVVAKGVGFPHML
jgi:hypothetical protein